MAKLDSIRSRRSGAMVRSVVRRRYFREPVFSFNGKATILLRPNEQEDAGSMPFPTIMPTIPALVRSCAASFGDKPIVIADEHVLTYVDLDTRSSRLAMALLAEGVGKGDHVGILMPNSVEW